MKVEVDVLGSPSLTVCAVSVDVKQHGRRRRRREAPAKWRQRGIKWLYSTFLKSAPRSVRGRADMGHGAR